MSKQPDPFQKSRHKVTSPLSEAKKMSAQAAEWGFDWEDVHGPLRKVEEEIQELREALSLEESKERLEEEFGDLLFALVNVARHLEISPDQALEKANQKFRSRVKFVEDCIARSDKPAKSFTLEELESFWQRAKEKRGL